MTVTRRHVLLGGSALTLAGVTLPRVLRATGMELGGRKLTTISDGYLVLPSSFALPPGREDEARDWLAAQGLSLESNEPPCNMTLVEDDDRKILFDAGSGFEFMASAGLMIDSLDALGLSPEDITDVVFTHAHPDHIGGVLDDFGDLTFADAQFWMGGNEHDYWADPETVNTIGEARAGFAVGAKRRIEAIADQLTLFDDGEMILPGITARASYGHTPGHMAFEVGEDGASALVVGDVMTNAHLAFGKPDWHSGSDQDPDMGAETRVKMLTSLETSGMPVVGFHLPGGGIGTVTAKDDAFGFVAS